MTAPTTTASAAPHTCPPEHPHNNTCYQHHRCRDAACRTAHTEDMRRRRREIAYGTYTRGRVNAAPVRAHMAWLRSQGMGPRTIARAAGVSEKTITSIIWTVSTRDGGRARTARVSPRTAARILAVHPHLDLLADHALIDGTGTRRRLQALVAHGWTLPALAAASADVMTAAQLHPLLHTTRVTTGNARTIIAIFDRLQLATPPQSTPTERAMVQRARRLAARNRWTPALAWDDIDTDPAVPTVGSSGDDDLDPIAVELALAGRGVRLTPGERRACVRVLHAKRWSDEAIGERLRCASKTVERIRRELDLHAWSIAELEVMKEAA